MIPEATLDEIRGRAREDIVPIISEYLELRRSGGHWVALCPFHDDRKPSLNINPEGYWKCFACDEGGDTIAFVQKYLGESFQGVISHLAQRFHIDLETDLGQDSRERLKAALTAAADYFATNLRTMREAEPARAELTRRGFDLDEAITRFGCGYAPPGYDRTTNYLRKAGFTDKELETAGLTGTTSHGKPYSFFRDRLTWAIRNSFGGMTGFGARRLSDDDQGPKYINSRETPLYKKSQALYGLNFARETIKQQHHALVVEGYTDVMAMHLAGVTNAVAACGVALGADHLKTLGLIVGETGEITTAMDDDAAGHRAALKIYDTAHEANIRQRLTILPPTAGLDPDDYRRDRGDAALAELAANRRPIIEAIIDRTLAAADRDSIEGRRETLGVLERYLAHVTDPILRGEYSRRVATDLGFRAEEVEGVLGPMPTPGQEPLVERPAPRQNNPAPRTNQTAPKRSHLIERNILAAFTTNQDIARTHYSTAMDTFTAVASQTMLAVLDTAMASPATDSPWPTRILAACGDNHAAQQATYSLLALPQPVHADNLDNHVRDLFRDLDRAQSEETIAELNHKLARSTDPKEQAQILEWILQLSDGDLT